MSWSFPSSKVSPSRHCLQPTCCHLLVHKPSSCPSARLEVNRRVLRQRLEVPAELLLCWLMQVGGPLEFQVCSSQQEFYLFLFFWNWNTRQMVPAVTKLIIILLVHL